MTPGGGITGFECVWFWCAQISPAWHFHTARMACHNTMLAPTYHMEGVPALRLFPPCALQKITAGISQVAPLACFALPCLLALLACLLLNARSRSDDFLVRTQHGETSCRDPLHMVDGYRHCIVTWHPGATNPPCGRDQSASLEISPMHQKNVLLIPVTLGDPW